MALEIPAKTLPHFAAEFRERGRQTMVESNYWLQSHCEFRPSPVKTSPRHITICIKTGSCMICKKSVNVLAELSGHRHRSFGLCVSPANGRGLLARMLPSLRCFDESCPSASLPGRRRCRSPPVDLPLRLSRGATSPFRG